MNTTTHTAVIMHDDMCCLEVHSSRCTYPDRQKHTIIYISHPYKPEHLKTDGIQEQPAQSSKGDDAELDKAWRKYNKAELKIQKQIINKAVEIGQLQESIAKELKWSRKAGCFCGCSPGWISRDYRRQSMWLNLTCSVDAKAKDMQTLSLMAI